MKSLSEEFKPVALENYEFENRPLRILALSRFQPEEQNRPLFILRVN